MYRVKYGKVMWRDGDGLHVVALGETCDPPQAVVDRHRKQLEAGSDDDFLGEVQDTQLRKRLDMQMKRRHRRTKK